MKLFEKEKKISELSSEQRAILEDVKKKWFDLVTVSDKNPSSSETEMDVNWIYDISGFSKPQVVVAESFEEYQKIPSFTSGTKSISLSYPINNHIDKKFRRRLIRNATKLIEKHVDNDILLDLMKIEQVFVNKTTNEILNILNNSMENNYLNGFFMRQHMFGLSSEFWLMTCYFFDKIGFLDEGYVKDDFVRYYNMMVRGIWHASFCKDVAIVCSTPKKVKKDDLGRLHSVSDGAVQWRNGQDDYFIHGVRFDERLWSQITKRELKIREILRIQNIEQRYVAIQLYGYDTLIDELECKLVDRSMRGNELYTLRDSLISGRSLKLLRYRCPSTDRIYFSFVPDDMQSADESMAWKFHLTPEEYQTLEIET